MANSFDLQRLILLITGAVFAGFSLLCLLYPDLLTRMTGILAPTLTSQIELQAVYGGLQLGLGVLLLICGIVPKWSRLGTWVLVAMVGGLALARGAGVAAHGWDSFYTGSALIYESLTALLGLLTLFFNPRLNRAPQSTPIAAPQPTAPGSTSGTGADSSYSPLP
ncbi:DUF4345 family protein [Candidatus Macondimonas diazotrophica]|jgi:hypothetical protein|uniref:DUF4345 domain-containing protein n=1 Tax=Candidatus Macondimonas diazotrophica TaxID=2305248 RepID=A0A4Z0FEJ8_9GAMM|nr:DUF4345 family protein [Candidatus Macondimonas diazotrophica]NCU00093.1 DUF4345 domain-containing protein [Candidatus Macondimonas diazotrophica]TFZ83878.1 DUF4345 domain-containing protein [Candidatus Macondimonas diazotrophica]HBG31211.1 hypothetical protein [Gammaproteobacteria bacterium]HBG52547.1 hypothetical protein [Gammaproteobacteria bacterium]